MSDMRAMVVQGDFTDEEFAQVVRLIREIDDQRPTGTFEVTVADSGRSSVEMAQEIMRRALPARSDRETKFAGFSSEKAECLAIDTVIRVTIGESDDVDMTLRAIRLYIGVDEHNPLFSAELNGSLIPTAGGRHAFVRIVAGRDEAVLRAVTKFLSRMTDKQEQ